MGQSYETNLPVRGARDDTPGWLEATSHPVTVWCLVALCFAVSWGPRLLRSFWTDEAATYFTAYKGIGMVSTQMAFLPQFSVLYSWIAALFCVDHGIGREFLLRVPSLAGVAIACFVVYRFAERAIGPGAGLIAAVLLLFNRDMLILGSQARPYSLAIAAATGSFLALYEWFETRSGRWLAGYTILSLLALYLHLFFGLVLLIHLVWASRVFIERRTMPDVWKLAGAWLAMGVLSLPLLPQIRATIRTAGSHIVMTGTTFSDLRDVLMRWEFALAGIVVALAIRYLFRRKLRRIVAPAGFVLFFLLTWWLLGPAILFTVGFFGGPQVFLARYMSYSFPAQALLITWLIWSVFELRAARIWVLVTVTLATVVPYGLLAPRIGGNELKPFMNIISEESSDQLPPVFFRTQFTESKVLDWRGGLMSPASFLYAPFVAYPMKNQLLPVPFYLDNDALDYIRQVVRTRLSQVPEVIWVSSYGLGNAWMIEEMRNAGFHAAIRTPNDYSVVIFRR